jgi:hypothetical protein
VPGGEQQRFELGSTVEFPAARCHACPLRAKCTDAGDNFASGSPSNTAKHTPAAARAVTHATSALARISLTFGAPAPSPTLEVIARRLDVLAATAPLRQAA